MVHHDAEARDHHEVNEPSRPEPPSETRFTTGGDPEGPPTIWARGLVKRYGVFEAVGGISFAVRAGECVGFLGPNGAGKTTTIRMISCVSPPSAGELEVTGLSVSTAARTIKQGLGVVPQDDNLERFLTVRENLELYGRYFGLSPAEARARAQELLAFVQLAEKSDENVQRLSGGMRRRLLIARALLNAPEILILDEPTTGLDPQARHLLWEKLRVLKAQSHTLLLTTHYMDEAEQLCDRVLIIDQGKIVVEGPPRQLVKDHLSSEVVEIYGPMTLRHDLQAELAGIADRIEVLEDRTLVFTPAAAQVVQRLSADKGAEAAETERLEFLTRRASLEDVFLKLTGRRLREES